MILDSSAATISEIYSIFLPSCRIDRLMLKVYRLAMRDFTNSRLGSSCAALMEMLGRDSTSFRIDLQCANRIAKYGDSKHPRGKISELGYVEFEGIKIIIFVQIQRRVHQVHQDLLMTTCTRN